MIMRVRLGTACARRQHPVSVDDIVVAVLGAVSGRAEHITAAAGSQAGAVFDLFPVVLLFKMLLSTVVVDCSFRDLAFVHGDADVVWTSA